MLLLLESVSDGSYIPEGPTLAFLFSRYARANSNCWVPVLVGRARNLSSGRFVVW